MRTNSIQIITLKNLLLTPQFQGEVSNFTIALVKLLLRDTISIGLEIIASYLPLVILIKYLMKQQGKERYFMAQILMVLVPLQFIPQKSISLSLRKAQIQISTFMNIQV